jgi:hypothetical protein
MFVIGWVVERMCRECHVTPDELCCTLYIGKHSVVSLIEELGCFKAYAHWVPQMLTNSHKELRKAGATGLLHQYNTGGESCL